MIHNYITMESEGSDSIFTEDGHEKIAFKSVKTKIYKNENNYNSFTVFHKLVAVYFAENVIHRGTKFNAKDFMSKNPKVNPDVLRKWIQSESNQKILQLLEQKHGKDHFESWIPGFSNEGVALQWMNTKNVLISFQEINKAILKGYGFSYSQTRLKGQGFVKFMQCLKKHGTS